MMNTSSISDFPSAYPIAAPHASMQVGADDVLSPTTTHGIYDRLLVSLEDRQLVHVPTGEIVPVFPDRSKVALRNSGRSSIDISVEESEHINCLSEHPNWVTQQSVPAALYYSLTSWDCDQRCRRFDDETDEDLLFDNRIVGVPHFLLNALVCEELVNMFDQATVLACSGFVERNDVLLLDVDPHLSKRGFIIPVLRGGLIVALKVFRSPKDEHPFILRTRSAEVAFHA